MADLSSATTGIRGAATQAAADAKTIQTRTTDESITAPARRIESAAGQIAAGADQISGAVTQQLRQAQSERAEIISRSQRDASDAQREIEKLQREKEKAERDQKNAITAKLIGWSVIAFLAAAALGAATVAGFVQPKLGIAGAAGAAAGGGLLLAFAWWAPYIAAATLLVAAIAAVAGLAALRRGYLADPSIAGSLKLLQESRQSSDPTDAARHLDAGMAILRSHWTGRAAWRKARADARKPPPAATGPEI
jgi:hypothetical protein